MNIGSVELLTRAADAAGRAAAASEAMFPSGVGWFVAEALVEQTAVINAQDARLIAASGPDHWRKVERLLRDGARVGNLVCGCCRAHADGLRDLAEQVLQALDTTEAPATAASTPVPQAVTGVAVEQQAATPATTEGAP
jgi:hypothetical protein